MPKPKGGLGRGLNALIPGGSQQQDQGQKQESGLRGEHRPAGAQEANNQPNLSASISAQSESLLMLSVDAIEPNPRQPRDLFREEELEELAASIREHGVLQPLVVALSGEPGRYSLIAGERRWRASRLAGLERVPAIVKEVTPREMLELALVENLQRADLNPLEEAAAYRSLIDDFGMRQEEVATRVGRSRGAVANALRLLRLPAPVLEALQQGLLTEGHARAILQAPTEEYQLALAARAVSEELNVRQVEELARRLAEKSAAEPERTEGAADDRLPEDAPLYDPYRSLEDQFRTALGTKVQLSRSRRGGKLVIYWFSDEELERIYGAIIRGEEE